MPALARSRRLARLVAAWVLLWFAALQATALLQLPAARPAAAPHHHAAEECDEPHPQHEGTQHEGTHTAVHHVAQCPGCLFSAAPPPQDFALAARIVVAPAAPLAPRAAIPRREMLAQPPARGPPRLA
jgi:hypothetical protein